MKGGHGRAGSCSSCAPQSFALVFLLGRWQPMARLRRRRSQSGKCHSPHWRQFRCLAPATARRFFPLRPLAPARLLAWRVQAP